MAIAFTKAPDGYNVEGNMPVQYGDLVLDNNYPTGGYPITAALFGLRILRGLAILGVKGTIANSSTVNFVYDLTNKKLMAIYPTGGGAAPAALGNPALAAGGTPVSSSAASGATPLIAGQGREVANGTDLSTITVGVKALGQG